MTIYTADFANGIEPKDLPEWPKDDQIRVMKDWFYQNYDDPANHLPHDKEEKWGYAWIWGGPVDAREALEDMFGEHVAEEFIDELVETLEHRCVVWTPQPSNHDEPWVDPAETARLDVLQAIETLKENFAQLSASEQPEAITNLGSIIDEAIRTGPKGNKPPPDKWIHENLPSDMPPIVNIGGTVNVNIQIIQAVAEKESPKAEDIETAEGAAESLGYTAEVLEAAKGAVREELRKGVAATIRAFIATVKSWIKLAFDSVTELL